jgi:hypothetical protein
VPSSIIGHNAVVINETLAEDRLRKASNLQHPQERSEQMLSQRDNRRTDHEMLSASVPSSKLKQLDEKKILCFPTTILPVLGILLE